MFIGVRCRKKARCCFLSAIIGTKVRTLAAGTSRLIWSVSIHFKYFDTSFMFTRNWVFIERPSEKVVQLLDSSYNSQPLHSLSSMVPLFQTTLQVRPLNTLYDTVVPILYIHKFYELEHFLNSDFSIFEMISIK